MQGVEAVGGILPSKPDEHGITGGDPDGVRGQYLVNPAIRHVDFKCAERLGLPVSADLLREFWRGNGYSWVSDASQGARGPGSAVDAHWALMVAWISAIVSLVTGTNSPSEQTKKSSTCCSLKILFASCFESPITL